MVGRIVRVGGIILAANGGAVTVASKIVGAAVIIIGFGTPVAVGKSSCWWKT